MGVLDKLADAVTGGLADTMFEAAKAYFPPDMSPQEEASAKLAFQQVELERQKATNAAVAESERAINERVALYEGTARDLQAIPVLGSILLFLRGSQRIAWGLGTLYMDVMVFSGGWDVEDHRLTGALWVINTLVLGFLFGERAIKNAAPMIAQIMEARK